MDCSKYLIRPNFVTDIVTDYNNTYYDMYIYTNRNKQMCDKNEIFYHNFVIICNKYCYKQVPNIDTNRNRQMCDKN